MSHIITPTIAMERIEDRNDPLVKLRLLCLSRGTVGILGFGKLFRSMDSAGTGTLSAAEFKQGLHDTGYAILTDNEVANIWSRSDHDEDGNIIYEEFLRYLRPPLNNARMALIEDAFAEMDVAGNGVVNLNDLKKCYSVKGNPDFENGRKTEDEILNTFLKTFEANAHIDGQLTKEEFIDYYSGVSASIDKDAHFDQMMRKAWGLEPCHDHSLPLFK